VNSLVCGLFFAVATWHIVKKASVLRTTGEVTETLQIIYYPFTYAVALGCLVLAFTFFVNFLKSILEIMGTVNEP
jgi:hypothetical protein